MKNQFITEVNRFQELAGIITESKKELKEEETALDPEVQALVDKIAPQIDEAKKTKLKEELDNKQNKIKSILSKIGDIEEKIYDQYGDNEIDAKFDYSKAIDNIKSKYKDDENQMYNALESHLEKLKKSFPLKEGFADYSELVMQILAGGFGAMVAVYFGSLVALAFKKGGKEEFQKALKELEKAHRGGSLGGF
jgi:FtsZ-binding cell division protein ZapB